MFEPLGLTEQDAAVLGAGLGTFVAAVLAFLRGARRGKPAPPTIEAVAKAGSCGADDLRHDVDAIQNDVGEMQAQLRGMRDILIRIEDRTARQ